MHFNIVGFFKRGGEERKGGKEHNTPSTKLRII